MQRSRPLPLLGKRLIQRSNVCIATRSFTSMDSNDEGNISDLPFTIQKLRISTLFTIIEHRSPRKKLYETHIPISGIERTVLTVASAVTALNNPLRGGKKIMNTSD